MRDGQGIVHNVLIDESQYGLCYALGSRSYVRAVDGIPTDAMVTCLWCSVMVFRTSYE